MKTKIPTISLFFSILSMGVLNAQSPSNDNLANATVLTVDATCTGNAYTNTGATAENNEVRGVCLNDTDPDPEVTVWFRFTAPSSGNALVTTDFAGAILDDTQLTAYSSPTTPATITSLTEIGCDEDGGTVVVFNSIMTLTGLTPGNTYYVQVDGFLGKTGGFCIEVQDYCSPPSGLAVSNIAITTAQLSWNAVATATNGYVWSLFNSGDDPSTATSVATVTTASGTTTATATGLIPGTAYDAYVRADCGGTTGQSSLNGPVAFTTAQLNDNLIDAFTLTVDAACTGNAYTNVGATAETNEPRGNCLSASDPNPEVTVWFTFTAPSSGNALVTTDFAGATLDDTQLTAYSSSTTTATMASLTEIGCDEDGGTVVGFNHRIPRGSASGVA